MERSSYNDETAGRRNPFLVDEITERVNREIGSVLQQLKDPRAKKELRSSKSLRGQ